ncbi:MAG: hypothetical protein IAE89_10675 [Anaerolineae bacterium]|nr:hypothetical protein [Anaerolineae bacterium]
MDGIQVQDAGLLVVFGVCGLCIVTLGVLAAIFFVFARFAGKDITSFFAELLRGESQASKTPPPMPAAKPNFKATSAPADFDVLVNQKMMQRGQPAAYSAQTSPPNQPPANAPPSSFSGYPAPGGSATAPTRSAPSKLDPMAKPVFDEPDDPFSQSYPQSPGVPPHPGNAGAGDIFGDIGDDIGF